MDAYERKMTANTKGGKNGQGATVEDMTNREGQESRMLVEVVKNRTGVS